MSGERAPWRHDAEVACMKSGAVKIGVGVVQAEPIEGPGMCGADFPLKVSALGESSPLVGYTDDLRPPGSIPTAPSQMPHWPINEPRYAPPADVAPAPVETMPRGSQQMSPAPQMRWVPGAPPAERPSATAPAGQPISLSAPGTEAGVTPSAAPLPDDIPDDAVLPRRQAPASYPQRAYGAPPQYPPPPRAPPASGTGPCTSNDRADRASDAHAHSDTRLSNRFCARPVGQRQCATRGRAMVWCAGRRD